MTLPAAQPCPTTAPARAGVPGFSRPDHSQPKLPTGWKRHPIRVLWRLARFALAVGAAYVDYFTAVKITGRSGDLRVRAAWMSRHARGFSWALGIEVTVQGKPPEQGIIVSNHLGYLDILVLGGAAPLIFVAKSETRGWPILGGLVRAAGTIFIRRDRVRDLRGASDGAPAPTRLPVAGGVVVAFFPEGTSTDASVVLPFRPALLDPAVREGWPVTPAHISYALEPGDGAAADEVCWWGDMELAPHLLNLCSKRRVIARVTFDSPVPPGDDRKKLARTLHARVCALARSGVIH